MASPSFKGNKGRGKPSKEWSVSLWTTPSLNIKLGGISSSSGAWWKFYESMISSTIVSSSIGVSPSCE